MGNKRETLGVWGYVGNVELSGRGKKTVSAFKSKKKRVHNGS